jgi:hypothetical protein
MRLTADRLRPAAASATTARPGPPAAKAAWSLP